MDDHSDLPNFVSTFGKSILAKAPDWLSELRLWAHEELCILRERGLAREIDALLDAKCEELPLFMAIKSSVFLDGVHSIFSKILGNQKSFEHTTEELEATACLLDAAPPELLSKQPFRKMVVSPLYQYKLLRDELRTLCKQMMFGKIPERYMLCAYVESATGRPHDREVSAIISVVTGEDLDETTLRVWRHDIRKIDDWFFELIWRLAHLLGDEQKKSN